MKNILMYIFSKISVCERSSTLSGIKKCNHPMRDGYKLERRLTVFVLMLLLHASFETLMRLNLLYLSN